ncbi:YjbQ family protein [Rhodovulum sp. 12E13]|uniref:secondary thiamine-phosphate synthase enzyme YjbQ n=1 Tax=Rhodovulum sp. 12E13 TaxID=2203891 RepID=UPI000E18EE76|nr:secondary thiamine-phosphate synthase enzyme YjbQ [Rhodovulum sp. 12E13]RDC68954.1 YjbQ family protein [Rhodovulum sp. 12E13]
MSARHRLIVDTPGPGLVEITGKVAEWVAGQGCDGLLTVFIRHTSASLLIQENADPDVRADLEAFFRRLAPHADRPGMEWITHRTEGPDDMPAHIKASVLPVSLSVPVSEGRLLLGRWQGLYLYEHRDRPHQREILLTLC